MESNGAASFESHAGFDLDIDVVACWIAKQKPAVDRVTCFVTA
jgi:hypothetical protein